MPHSTGATPGGSYKSRTSVRGLLVQCTGYAAKLQAGPDRLLRARVAVDIEIEVEHFSTFNFAGSRQLEAELLEQGDGRTSLDAHIEDDLEVTMMPAEYQRLLDELGANAMTPMRLAHSESADLRSVL